jgi:hypothetical protein
MGFASSRDTIVAAAANYGLRGWGAASEVLAGGQDAEEQEVV